MLGVLGNTPWNTMLYLLQDRCTCLSLPHCPIIPDVWGSRYDAGPDRSGSRQSDALRINIIHAGQMAGFVGESIN